ncbi:hypothetical protein D5272_18810 [bacterium D16-76]|nr:hypothetical protein [bacterium D16-76]
MAVKGVDLSTHNKVKDYAALKASGIEFAILRTGYGSDYPGQQDALFEKHIAGCEAAGIAWGAYHYGYARDRQGGIDEAKHCLRILAGRKPAYGVWYDMEDESTLGGDLARAAQGFCSTIEAAGLYAGVYSNYNWFTHYLTDPVFDRYDRWAAQYNSVCELKKPYGIWQFTDRLYIDGVQLDCNWAYKDYPALTKGGGKVSGKSRVLATQENKITNPFGNGHSGVDLGWQTTQTDGILAHSPGQVVFCQTGQQNNKGSSGNASYGNCVKIKHPGGYATLYAHLSAVSVSTGQQVEKGQQIGRMGNTGNSYGNHLHFEVRNQNDVCIDPAPFIAADLPGLITEKEEADMTEDRMREIAWEEAARQNPTYNTLEDVPDYWREDIAQLVEDGIIKGTGDGKLGLTKSEVKAAVIIKRAMEKA